MIVKDRYRPAGDFRHGGTRGMKRIVDNHQDITGIL